METRYYYIRFQRIPAITVCILVDGKSVSRGVAACSMSDNPCKKEGRRIALNRARKANGTHENDKPLKEVPESFFRAMMSENNIYMMQEFLPILSMFEAKLISNI